MVTKAPPPTTLTGQSADQQWQFTFNTDVQYYNWNSSQGYPHLALQFPADPRGPGTGSQVYVPVGFQAASKINDLQLQFLVRSGYINSQQTTGGVSGSVSTATDTTFGGTVTYSGIAGVQPFVSLNINAPTGTSVLYGNNTFARPDPDLSAVPTFGEGWNFGPTVGVNVPITSVLVATVSGGYTSRGSYNREASIPAVGPQGVDSVSPGNDWTLNAALAYQRDKWSAQLSAAYQWETTTFINGLPVYKTGDNVTTGFTVGYAWTQQWASQLGGSFTHTNRNLVQSAVFPPVVLTSEASDSNSDITKVLFSTTYTQGKFTAGPTANYTYRNRNDWDPTSASFLPAKNNWGVGGLLQYNPTAASVVTARVTRMWTYEFANPDKLTNIGIVAGSGYPAISSNEWILSVSGTIKF